MLKFDIFAVTLALKQSWSKASARQWRADNPALGQCNVTAILVDELYGGGILKTPLATGTHFYNLINGERFDFTASQFDQPIVYADLPSCRSEALAGVAEDEYQALKAAFLLAIRRVV